MLASTMSGQHDVGRNEEPERVIAHERNVDEHCDDGEARDDERNDVHAEDIEHRRCPYTPRNLRMIHPPTIQWRSRSRTNPATTSLDRPHPMSARRPLALPIRAFLRCCRGRTIVITILLP